MHVSLILLICNTQRQYSVHMLLLSLTGLQCNMHIFPIVLHLSGGFHFIALVLYEDIPTVLSYRGFLWSMQISLTVYDLIRRALVLYNDNPYCIVISYREL